MPLFRRAAGFAGRTAIVAADGRATYADILSRSRDLARALLDTRRDLAEDRVILLTSPGAGYVVGQWAIWRAGGVVVPLAGAQAPPEWAHVLDDCRPAAAIVDPSFADAFVPLARQRGVRVLAPDGPTADPPVAVAPAGVDSLAVLRPDRRAMILYTSGTTSRPKGAVLTHANLEAQVRTLVEAWAWTPDDRILHVLPLNHTHGIVNVLGCALWSGACCEMLPRFDPDAVWDRLADGDLTLFMAVPTIYRRLVTAWESADAARQAARAAGAQRLRLMVSGSAALPVGLLDRWRAITGHVLLERYGMTEIGMALSNLLDGERRPGFVGVPLPGVEIRLAAPDGGAPGPAEPAEILVRGPGVFLEYWNRPDATASAFRHGWFQTGDVAVVERGMYRILGRSSVDIIKTGGYKVSALEIEETLREHPAIADCAVVGTPDPEWGERVAVAAVLRGGALLTLDELRRWARGRMAGYKLPGRLVAVPDLPRNAMGKVSKPTVATLFVEPTGPVAVH